MSLIKIAKEAIPSISKKVKDYFAKPKKKAPEKKEKQVDITDKKPENKINPEKKFEDQRPGDVKTWTDEINIERRDAANLGAGKAKGRAKGDLDKIENAPSSKPGQERGIGERIRDIEEKSKLKGNIEETKTELEPTHKEKIGEKRIEQILENGKPKEGKSWGDRVKPDSKLEFESTEGGQSKAVELLKGDSSKYFLPESRNTEKLIMDDNGKKKMFDLLNENRENSANEFLSKSQKGLLKNENKIDAYDAVTKTSAQIEAKKEDSFLEAVQRDTEVNENRLEIENMNNVEMEGGGDIEFDFD